MKRFYLGIVVNLILTCIPDFEFNVFDVDMYVTDVDLNVANSDFN